MKLQDMLKALKALEANMITDPGELARAEERLLNKMREGYQERLKGEHNG